jgi:hypothetical protein
MLSVVDNALFPANELLVVNGVNLRRLRYKPVVEKPASGEVRQLKRQIPRVCWLSAGV